MSRLRINTPDQAELTMEHLYLDLERHIAASTPGLCPVDMQISFLRLCHAQSYGKCVPCRIRHMSCCIPTMSPGGCLRKIRYLNIF